MRLLRGFSLLLMLLIGVVFDAQENGELQFPLLLPGEPIEGNMTSSVSTDLYVLNGTAGDVVSIEMQANDALLDPFLILLGAAGEVVALNNDRELGVENALIADVELPETGTYLVVASSYENLDQFIEITIDEPLSYTLTASGFTPPTELTTGIFALFSGQIDVGQTLIGESTVAEPVYYVTFDATAGDLVDITMRALEDIDPILHVFAPDGSRIALNDDDLTAPIFTIDSAVTGLEIPETGRYLIFATDVFFYNVGDEDTSLAYTPGTFELTLGEAPPPPTEQP